MTAIWMTTIWILCIILSQFIRGIKEGIIWYQGDIMLHQWQIKYQMDSWYHLFDISMFSLWAISIFIIGFTWPVNIALIIGALLLSWEMFEIGYHMGRLYEWKQLFDYENFLGVLQINNRLAVCVIHVSRIVSGLWLILA